MPSVDIRNLSISYAGAAAVKDASFRVEAGEFFFLLGPSGCGKSSILRAIAGFVTPASGRISIGEEDITDLAPNKRKTAMVFQNYALWPHLSVAGNVAYGLEVRRVPRAERASRVAEALEMVGLTGYGEREPETLSGGEQQRVALARALVTNPEVLLLDEPLSNLDARMRDALREEIASLIRRLRITAIYVTHDTREALAMADRIAVMRSGAIRQAAMPREIYERPADAFVAGFVGEVSELAGEIVVSGERPEAGGKKDGRRPLVVKTALGEFAVSDGADWKAGDTAVVCIRPERVRVSPAGEADAGVGGRVVRAVYSGAQEEIQVEAGGVMVKALRAGAGAPMEIGAEVRVSIEPGAGMVFRGKT
jgi:iron(III) transport system ATP-binding protein